MDGQEIGFRGLRDALLDYEGSAVLAEVVAPWMKANPAELERLRSFAARPGDPIPSAEKEDLWQLYALSRVLETLLLPLADRPSPRLPDRDGALPQRGRQARPRRVGARGGERSGPDAGGADRAAPPSLLRDHGEAAQRPVAVPRQAPAGDALEGGFAHHAPSHHPPPSFPGGRTRLSGPGAREPCVASVALVRSCGFSQEGYSPRYLKIGGRWRDHERWALLARQREARKRTKPEGFRRSSALRAPFGGALRSLSRPPGLWGGPSRQKSQPPRLSSRSRRLLPLCLPLSSLCLLQEGATQR